jgi:DNA-binding transcriptional ArsR family regulator
MIATAESFSTEVESTQPVLRDGAEVVRIAQALADPHRVTIVTHLLVDDELNVTEICNRLDQSQPAVSHHLKRLRESRVLTMRRDGKCNFYSLSDSCSELVRSLMLV